MKGPVLAGLLALSATSFAQDKPALRVVIEGLGKEETACGIKSAAVESTASRVLANGGVRTSTDAADPYLYINVNAYRVMQGGTAVGCATRVGVSVRAPADREPKVRGFKPKADVYVVLCDAGRLLSGSQRDVSGAVNRALEEDIKACLGRLSY
jgi:hypothetical protein